MRRSKKARRMLAAIVIALFAAMAAPAAMADNVPVSECDALEQGVVLYEKMTGEPVTYPQQLIESGYDEIFLKSVAMGYVNLDDFYGISSAEYIRKQDFMNILYKTIITYNPNFAIDGEETERILNDCFDNAYLDEENRTAYAFMIKEGLIRDTMHSEPDSELTWDGCAVMVELAYNLFANGESVTVGGEEIKIGENIDTVISDIGMPNRIDESDYDFDWYVYNGDYGNFMMLGVDGDRICAFFTNAPDFEYRGIRAGDDFAKIVPYLSDNLRVITDGGDKIDAVMYNPRGKETNVSEYAKQARAAELLDMINANRVRNGRAVYSENKDLNAEAFLASISGSEAEGAEKAEGYDIFSIYSQMVRSGADIIEGESTLAGAVGIDVALDETNDFAVTAQIITNNAVPPEMAARAPMEEAEPIEEEPLNEVEEVTTPVIVSPEYETVYGGTEDVVIELAMQASTQYHIEVFDYENDDYVVNKYVTTDDMTFTLPGGLFTFGRDYKIIVSALGDDGTALSSEPVLITYGSQYDDGVKLISPYNDGVTDDDIIAASWESDTYSDFYVDLYKAGEGLIVSEIVEGDTEAMIRGVDPGEYYLYITALRKGTVVEKAQDMAHFTVTQPEPVINEIILEPDEIYNFVYEDEALGVLYFYDEDIIEVEDENGETVKRKKIIQKQVKATKAYKRLSSYIARRPSTTGAPFISSGASTVMGNAIVTEAAKYLDVPYVWGGTSPEGFDCSGLVQYVCASLGITVDRVAEDQFRNGVPVNRDELMPGDLIFFEQNGYIHHVGIYAGDNMMIHAPHTGDVVRYASLDNEYYQREYAGARRVY